MRAADLQAIVAPLDLAALRALTNDATAEEGATLARAWFATHPAMWSAALFPTETRYGFTAAPRARLTARFAAIPPALPGRTPHRYCAEMYRGCGKTALMRLMLVLGRLLHRQELGALLVNRNADMASPHSRSIMGLVPQRRARPGQPAASPFALLYPGVEWSGSVEAWTLHVPHLPGLNDEPHDAPVYTRGIGGDLRGFLQGFTRPTLAVFDDIETADSARSPTERESVWRAVTEEAAGIAPEDIGLTSIMLCNALSLDDASARAEADPGWIHDRIGVWERAPEETPLVRELEALWHSTPGAPEAKNAAVAAHPRAAEVEALTTMSDPHRSVLWALCLRWSEGRKPFARMRECLRTSHGERTFDMDKIALCHLGSTITRADASTVPLAALDVAIWLDPRFSKNDKKNDYAAIVAVARDKEGRRYTLDADLKRDRGSATRARVWSMLDRLLALGADPRRIRIAYETNGGSEGAYEETFDDDITARRRAGLFCPPIEGFNTPSTSAKLDRIETMEDALHSGRWQIAAHLVKSELWQQLQLVPHGTHDDGPDAMERAGSMLAAPVTWAARAAMLRGGR